MIIADHPFFIDGIGQYLIKNPKILEDLDGFEVHNGEAAFPVPGFLRANQKALEFYQRAISGNFEVGGFSFSDGHSIYL